MSDRMHRVHGTGDATGTAAETGQRAHVKSATVMLTHSPSALANYYGARALAALRSRGAGAAQRQRRCRGRSTRWPLRPRTATSSSATAAPRAAPTLLARLPRLVAFCRCAVDIRNVDVAAASAQGILVTQASAGFMTAVAEWIARRDDRPRAAASARRCCSTAPARTPAPRDGPRAARRDARHRSATARSAARWPTLALALRHARARHDPHAARRAARRCARCALAELLAEADFVVCLRRRDAPRPRT